MENKPIQKPFVIDGDYWFPFSRGILAQTLIGVGLPMEKAYHIATEVQEQLFQQGIKEITTTQLKEFVASLLSNSFDVELVDKFKKFKSIRIEVIAGSNTFPYSKGIMAQSLKSTGLAPGEAFEIARKIENFLILNHKTKIEKEELRHITCEFLNKECGSEIAERYLIWRSIKYPQKPFIILFGGATGVGKSTIAAEIAHRLGITRVLSTDAIRQIMRIIITPELMPTLHHSSFSAWKAWNAPLPVGIDPVIIAFRDQAQKVAVGVMALIERAIKENVNLILDGVHIVPGFFKEEYFEKADIALIIFTITDEKIHKSRFQLREGYAQERSALRYLENFASIRTIQHYIIDRSRLQQCFVIENIDFDETIKQTLNYLTEFIKSRRKEKKQ